MQYAQKQILKMVIPRDHCRQVFEVSCKFLQFDQVVWLDVVPTPNEFVECFFFWFLQGHHFRMFFSIINLSQGLYSNLRPCYLFDSLIGFNNGFVSILIKISSYLVQEISIRDELLLLIGFNKESEFIFRQEDLSTLKAPSKIIFIQDSNSFCV